MRIQMIIISAIIVTIAIANIIMVSRNINCSYSNSTGSFTFQEMNAAERTYNICLKKFGEFKKKSSDTLLYRLCSKNYFKFWNWGAYLFQEKYKLPYKQWKEIERQRGNVGAKSGFQDF